MKSNPSNPDVSCVASFGSINMAFFGVLSDSNLFCEIVYNRLKYEYEYDLKKNWVVVNSLGFHTRIHGFDSNTNLKIYYFVA